MGLYSAMRETQTRNIPSSLTHIRTPSKHTTNNSMVQSTFISHVPPPPSQQFQKVSPLDKQKQKQQNHYNPNQFKAQAPESLSTSISSSGKQKKLFSKDRLHLFFNKHLVSTKKKKRKLKRQAIQSQLTIRNNRSSDFPMMSMVKKMQVRKSEYKIMRLNKKNLSERTLYTNTSPQFAQSSSHEHNMEHHMISSQSMMSPPPFHDEYTLSYTPTSMDTNTSTPRAKSANVSNGTGGNRRMRLSISRCDTEKVVNRKSTSISGASTFDSSDDYEDAHDEHENNYVANRHDGNAEVEGGNDMKVKYELPPSVSFLSLVLPCAVKENDVYNYDEGSVYDEHGKENRVIHKCIQSSKAQEQSTKQQNYHPNNSTNRQTIAPSIISVSDATTATSTSGTGLEDVGSIVSGQTTLARDRVQETIASLANIDYYLNKSSNTNNNNLRNNNNHQGNSKSDSEDTYNRHHLYLHDNSPVNVDFVLESNEHEIASFANSFVQSKKYIEAIDIYLTILDHYQKQHGHEYHFVITTLHNLGVVHALNGNYKQAMFYCKEALKRRKKTLGQDHVDVATSLCELATIYYAKEDFNKGIEVLRQALHITCNQCSIKAGKSFTTGAATATCTASNTASKTNPKTDCKVAMILNNIACFHFSIGKLMASIATFEESLEVMRRIIGTITCDKVGYMLLNMSITLCNAGIVYAKNNQSDTASSFVEEGLMVQQSILPDDHRLVRSTIGTLSNVLNDDEIGLPTPMAVQTVEIHTSKHLSDSNQQNQMANKSLYRCTDMLTLGPVYEELNSPQRVSLSVQYGYLAEAILIEGESKRHCSWVDAERQSNDDQEESNLSEVCAKAARMIKQKKLSKAINLFDQVRQSHGNKIGDVTYILSSVHQILGIIHLHSQNFQTARSEFYKAAKLRSRQLDPDNLDVLSSQTKRAITMVAMQDFEKALSIFQSQLTQLRKRFGYSNFRVALILNNIGICHYELGGMLTALKTFEEAVEIIRDAITQVEKQDTDERYDLLVVLSRSLNNLSFVLFKRKQYAEASMVFEECLKIVREAFGNNHNMVRSTVKCLSFVMATANCLDNKDKLERMTNMYVEMLSQ